MAEELYTVQKIIGKRTNKKNQIEYLVKWQGYTTDDSTWEPSRNLKYVSNMVNQYEKQLKKKSNKNGSRFIKKRRDQYESEEQQQLKAIEDLEEDRPNQMAQEIDNIKNQKIPKNNINRINKNLDTRLNENKEEPTKKDQLLITESEEELTTQRLKSIEQKIRFTIKAREEEQKKAEKKKKELRVLEICREGDSFCFLTIEQGIKCYYNREYMMDNFPDELIRFYESKIEFVKIPKVVL